MLKNVTSPATEPANLAHPTSVRTTVANRAATSTSDFSARGIARRAVWILVVPTAVVIALVEVAWQLELILKLLPA